MDDIAAGHVFREGLDTRGVETGIGLGETEGNLILTRDKTRHPPGLLLVSALYDDRMRAEKIDVDRRCRRHATAMTRDFVHPRRRFGEIGRASWRARVCQDVSISVVPLYINKKNHI